ncbi:MAG: DR2241 family protein [Tepidiformaceae bacterium]
MDVTGREVAGLPSVIGRKVEQAETFSLGQVGVRLEGNLAVIAGPGTERREVPGTPEALREAVRLDDLGRYRPLSGATSMPRGWWARISVADLAAALEAVYPLALDHMAAAEAGGLRIVPLADVLERQSGRYSVAAELDGEGRRVASGVLCRDCVRVPVWRGDFASHDALDIPCPEPCSVLVSLCREAALWQKSRPAPAPPDPTIAFAAFETPGNEVREAYLAAR